MIVGLAGYARAGKDTVGSILVEDYGFKRVALADKMKEALAILNPIISAFSDDYYGEVELSRLDSYRKEDGTVDYEKAKFHENGEVRRLLQVLGTEVGRNLFGPSFWIGQAFRNVNAKDNIVVTDVRFPNEASFIADRAAYPGDGRTFWIKRPGIKPANSHVSELALIPEMLDGIIYNDQDKNYMKRLKDQVERKIING